MNYLTEDVEEDIIVVDMAGSISWIKGICLVCEDLSKSEKI